MEIVETAADMRDQVVAEEIEVLVRRIAAAHRAAHRVPVEAARLVQVAHREREVELADGVGHRVHEATSSCGACASRMFCQNRFQALMLRS